MAACHGEAANSNLLLVLQAAELCNFVNQNSSARRWARNLESPSRCRETTFWERLSHLDTPLVEVPLVRSRSWRRSVSLVITRE